ncbi:MAG: hypothetical protein SGJ18_07945 [Pseudomonadota bacterium]|nr:hypothetical protein [Pseudomonadota bacterium]
MNAKNSLVGALAITVALITTGGCARSGGFKPVKPPADKNRESEALKQKETDVNTLKELAGKEWVFDFANHSFPDEASAELGKLIEADDKSLDADISENGRNVFPKTLNFSSDKEVKFTDNAGNHVEATYTLVDGMIELTPKDSKDTVKMAGRGFVEMGNSQMTWTTENPAPPKSKMVFVFKRSR